MAPFSTSFNGLTYYIDSDGRAYDSSGALTAAVIDVSGLVKLNGTVTGYLATDGKVYAGTPTAALPIMRPSADQGLPSQGLPSLSGGLSMFDSLGAMKWPTIALVAYLLIRR